MLILVEKWIPFGSEVFSSLGKVLLYDGSHTDEIEAPEANILVTRSNVHVDHNLLEKLPNLQIILSPTIGLDHIDQSALTDYQRTHKRIVQVINAPGSTAGGVGDYVIAAVLELQSAGLLKKDCCVGIWGYGNCGHAVERRLRTNGCKVVTYDPPLEVATRGKYRSAPLEQLLSCDCVTLHLPLTKPAESSWPTQDIVDRKILAGLHGKVLINTSRGRVLMESEAIEMAAKGDLTLVMDVYRDEPNVNLFSIDHAFIATPHIAGSIRQGKLRALRMVYEALCQSMDMVPSYGFDRLQEKLSSPYKISGYKLKHHDIETVRKAVKLIETSNHFKQSMVKPDVTKRLLSDRDIVIKTFNEIRKNAIRDEIIWPFST